jgi:hypothetical protein
LKELYRTIISAVLIALSFMPTTVLAGGTPVPYIGAVTGTQSNGWYTSGFTIDVIAHCIAPGPINDDHLFSSSALGASLLGTHTLRFFNDDTGNVYYSLDSGGMVAYIISCPPGNATRTLDGSPIVTNLDLAAPVVRFTSPLNGQTYQPGAVVHITGDISDDASGVTSMMVNSVTTGNNGGHFSLDYVLPTNGVTQYTFTAYALDNAFHAALSPQVTVQIVAAAQHASVPTKPSVAATPAQTSPPPSPTSAQNQVSITPSPQQYTQNTPAKNNEPNSQTLLAAINSPTGYAGLISLSVLITAAWIYRHKLIKFIFRQKP